MGTIRLPGLLTGLDTTTLIAQLMAIKRRQFNKLEESKSRYQEKTSALNLLESKLSSLRSSVRSLSDADELRAFSASSSDKDILTAQASYNAFEGNHTVEINQLANAERWIHTNGLEYVEDLVGAGTFIYSYNHKETILTTTSETTLEDFVGLINNDANNPGVTAGLLHYNDAYHLVLNGNGAGTDYKILINAGSTKVWQPKSDFTFTVDSDNATLSTKITELDQFTVNNGLQGGEQIEITGTDHNGADIPQVDLDITENTTVGHLLSEINDAFDGRAKAVFENGEIILTDNTSGTSNLSILLTYDPGTGDTELTLPDDAGKWDVTDGGDTLASGLNNDFQPADFTLSQAAQDSKIKVDGFPSTSAVAEVQHLDWSTKASTGYWTLTYDGQTTADIARNASTADVQAALELLTNVSTGDITVGGDILTTQNGTMTFEFTNIPGDVNMLVIDTSILSPPDPSNWVFTEDTKGQDGYINRSSNTVDDVISGVTLHLHDTTEAGGEKITLTRDIRSVKAKLNSMISGYNAVVVYLQEKTGYNKELKTAGVLMGDYIISTIRNNIRTPIISQTSGFLEDIDTFLLPLHLGLEIDRDGLLSLDSNVFDEAIAEDYLGALAIIGAAKTGSSDSNTLEFYGASSNYTTAGSYDVKVTINASEYITSAEIRLSGESAYRTAIYSGNMVTGNSTFDDNGNPVYPENGLQVSVDVTQGEGTYEAIVQVKQGFTGVIEEAIEKMIMTATGSIPIAREHTEDIIEEIEHSIELEERRLKRSEERLIQKFTRLEVTLTLLQNQMTAFGLIVQVSYD